MRIARQSLEKVRPAQTGRPRGSVSIEIKPLASEMIWPCLERGDHFAEKDQLRRKICLAAQNVSALRLEQLLVCVSYRGIGAADTGNGPGATAIPVTATAATATVTTAWNANETGDRVDAERSIQGGEIGRSSGDRW